MKIFKYLNHFIARCLDISCKYGSAILVKIVGITPDADMAHQLSIRIL